jgi:hypothetical protein
MITIVALFLQKYEYLLGKAIEELKLELPEDMAITSETMFGQAYVTYPALAELETVLGMLSDDIKVLQEDHERRLTGAKG